MSDPLTPAGRQLLDRRNFLGHLGGGLGAIGLIDMLARAEEASRKPIRPAIDAEAPLAARDSAKGTPPAR